MKFLFSFFFIINLNVLAVSSSEINTIDGLIQTALTNHPSIQMSQQMIAGADAQVSGARWGYFPSPSVDYSKGSSRGSTTLRLDQPIWTGGKLDAAMDIAESKKHEAEYSLDELSYTLVENLLNTAQNYLIAQGDVLVLQEGKKQLVSLSDMLKRRIEAGVSAIADQDLIQSRLEQIDSDLKTAEIKRDMAHAQLELIVGSPIDQSIEFKSNDYLHHEGDVKQFISEMIETHPTLKKLDAQIKTAQGERDKAKAAIWPNVSLRAEHMNGSVYYDNATKNDLLYVAVQMSPGAGLSAFSNIQLAETNILKAQFEKTTKERELSDILLRDYNSYRSAMDRIIGMDKTINASDKVFESYTRLFVAGKRQWLDLVNASRELTQYKVTLSDIKASLSISAYQLALQRGEMKLIPGDKQK
ncbi:MAG: TolC family protein [Sulfuricurvum sp.]|nr:TolC family protein [Sulfuricurvum sp.]